MKNKSLLSSSFFTVPKEISKEKLKRYCELWIHLQVEVTLGTLKLNGKLAEELLHAVLRSHIEEELLIENLIKVQALAAIDELGIGRKKTLMHHKLFSKQVIDSGINIESLTSNVRYLPEEVMLLKSAINNAFSLKQPNSLPGLSMSYVIETMAPQLFASQYKIFSHAGIKDRHLRHSKIHMKLEKKHAMEAESMYSNMEILYSVDSVANHVRKYSILWKNFLDMVAKEIY